MQLNFSLSPLLLPSPLLLGRCSQGHSPIDIRHTKLYLIISESASRGIQLAECSLISFLFQLCSWVPCFLACWWHPLLLSLELTTAFLSSVQVFHNLPLQPFSLLDSPPGNIPSPVTCWILLTRARFWGSDISILGQGEAHALCQG